MIEPLLSIAERLADFILAVWPWGGSREAKLVAFVIIEWVVIVVMAAVFVALLLKG